MYIKGLAIRVLRYALAFALLGPAFYFGPSTFGNLLLIRCDFISVHRSELKSS